MFLEEYNFKDKFLKRFLWFLEFSNLIIFKDADMSISSSKENLIISPWLGLAIEICNISPLDISIPPFIRR